MPRGRGRGNSRGSFQRGRGRGKSRGRHLGGNGSAGAHGLQGDLLHIYDGPSPGRGRGKKYIHVSSEPMLFTPGKKLFEQVEEEQLVQVVDYEDLEVEVDTSTEAPRFEPPRIDSAEKFEQIKPHQNSSHEADQVQAVYKTRYTTSSTNRFTPPTFRSQFSSNIPNNDDSSTDQGFGHAGLGFVVDSVGSKAAEESPHREAPSFILGSAGPHEEEVMDNDEEQSTVSKEEVILFPSFKPGLQDSSRSTPNDSGPEFRSQRPQVKLPEKRRTKRQRDQPPPGWNGETFEDGLDGGALDNDEDDMEDLADILQMTTTDDPILDPKYQQMILNSVGANQASIADLHTASDESEGSSEEDEDDDEDDDEQDVNLGSKLTQTSQTRRTKYDKYHQPAKRPQGKRAGESSTDEDSDEDMEEGFRFDDGGDDFDEALDEEEEMFTGGSSRWAYLDKVEDLLNADLGTTSTGKKKRNKGVGNELFNAIQNGDFDDEDEVYRASDFAARLKRSKNKNAPDAETELEWSLKAQWKLDKAKKAEKKRERQAARMRENERFEGKKTKKQLKKMVGQEIDLYEVNATICDFVRDPTMQSLPLPPMDKNDRRRVHILAIEYNLKSKSIGGGVTRYPVLIKTQRAEIPSSDKKIRRILMSGPNPRSAGGSNNRLTPAPPPASRNADGMVVGAKARPIEDTNLGHQMLVKMGWSKGQVIGREGGGGIDAPISAIVKNSRLGLGA